MLYDNRLLHPWFTRSINAAIDYQGETVYIVALTQYRRETVLWALQRVKQFDNPIRKTPLTQRDCLVSAMQRDPTVDVKMLRCGNLFLHFIESHSFCLRDEGIHHRLLRRFIREGLPENFHGTSRRSDWCLIGFVQVTPKPFPTEKDFRGSLTLTLRGHDRQLYLGQQLTLAFGNNEDPMRRSWHDKHTGRTLGYYVNALERYDPCRQMEELYNNPDMRDTLRSKGLTETQAEAHYQKVLETARCLCPEGSSLVLLKYETENEIQLQFHTRAVLDGPPANSAMALCFTGEKAIGVKGYTLRCCALGAVPLDHEGPLELELLSRWLIEPDRDLVLTPAEPASRTLLERMLGRRI